MEEILGNPGILGQGGVSSSPYPRMLLGWGRYLGIPGYLNMVGYLVHPILGCSWDGGDTWGSQDTWTRGGINPRMFLGWERYWEWGRYVLKGEVAHSILGCSWGWVRQ